MIVARKLSSDEAGRRPGVLRQRRRVDERAAALERSARAPAQTATTSERDQRSGDRDARTRRPANAASRPSLARPPKNQRSMPVDPDPLAAGHQRVAELVQDERDEEQQRAATATR